MSDGIDNSPMNGSSPSEGTGRASDRASAHVFYLKGNEYRRQGNWQEAINCYLEAIAIDPDSPAVHAKEMLDDILNYYNKDLYNP